MVTNKFFEEQEEQSLIKATIVAKYFNVWANVIIATQKKYPGRSSGKIAYIDLFAGPGRYRDGAQSTPLKILENAINNPEIRDHLVTMFNDKDEENAQSLEKAIAELPGIKTLKYYPQVNNEEVGEEIVKMFERMKLIPTLFFVDPWGYKGLSLRLVNSVLKDWGCDCIFFFNYNRINMGLSNPIFKSHMDALFGEARAEKLRPKLTACKPEQRHLIVIEGLCEAIKDYGSRYTLPSGLKTQKAREQAIT